jgi:hypothetical protein
MRFSPYIYIFFLPYKYIKHGRFFKNIGQAWWFKPTILTSWEVDIRRITIKSASSQPVSGWGGTCLSSQWEAQIGG